VSAPTVALDPDGPRSAALANLVEHLTGPLAAGAVLEQVALDGAGHAEVRWQREPLLLLRLDQDLGLDTLDVAVRIGPLAAGPPAPGTGFTASLRFAAYSERGASLPVWPFGAGAPGLDDAAVAVEARRVAADGAAEAVPASALAALLGLTLVQGTTGRVAFLLGAEKATLRRAARETAASRTLAGARSGSLDRHGRDLGVARFADRLVGSAGPPAQISTAPRLEPDGLEPDRDYRRRLAAMRSFAVPTRAGVIEAVNGPGTDDDAPSGWLAELGATQRVRVVEQTNPFAVGVLVVSSAGQQARDDFLAALRRDRLVRPVPSEPRDAAYASRMLTLEQRQDMDRLGEQLTAGYAFEQAAAADPAFAEGLARGLALAAGARAALGNATRWRVTRAQDDAGGSRYELGLGCDLVLPPADEAEALRVAAVAWTPASATPAELAGVLAAVAQAAAAGPDPRLRWLLTACGLRTVFPLDELTVFASSVPMLGMEITGPAVVGVPGWSHVVAVPAAARTVVRYDRGQRVLQVVTVPDKGEPTVLAAAGGVPAMDAVVCVGLRGGLGELGFIIGYERAAGTVHVLRPAVGGVFLVRSVTGWTSRWSAVVTGEFGGPTAYQDVVFYERETGGCAVYGVDPDGGFAPAAAMRPVAGLASATALGRIGSWSHLAVVPGSGGSDLLLGYDQDRGDVQAVEMDSSDGLRVRWQEVAWRPGFSQLLPVPPPGPGSAATLLGYDREQGRLSSFGDVEGGSLVPLGTAGLPARAVTHAAVTRAGDGPRAASRVVVYDRATGLGGWWAPALVGSAGTADAEPGAIGVPREVWSTAVPTVVSAALRAAGDAAGPRHAALVDGLDRAAADWAARGGAPWRAVHDRAEQQSLWSAVADPGPAGAVFRAVGLVTAPAAFPDEMATVPVEYTATLVVPAVLAEQWRVGAGLRQARALVDVLQGNGLASAVGLVATTADIAVVVSVVGLPGAGLNLSGRAAAGYRWYCPPLRGLPGVVSVVGSSTVFRPADEGLSALVVLGYQRIGQADPYEVLLELPEEAALTLEQYEFLLNTVERAVAAGIQVNTLSLRRRHLDLEPDGQPNPLPATAAHVYRRFRVTHGKG